jgi:hypothetical protein
MSGSFLDTYEVIYSLSQHVINYSIKDSGYGSTKGSDLPTATATAITP